MTRLQFLRNRGECGGALLATVRKQSLGDVSTFVRPAASNVHHTRWAQTSRSITGTTSSPSHTTTTTTATTTNRDATTIPTTFDFSNFLVLLIGPPGSGKGTQTHLLCDQFKFMSVSAGDTLRQFALDENCKEKELAKEVRTLLANGQLVPEHITARLMRTKLLQNMRMLQELNKQGLSCGGLVMEGYPRAERQVPILLNEFVPALQRELSIGQQQQQQHDLSATTTTTAYTTTTTTATTTTTTKPLRTLCFHLSGATEQQLMERLKGRMIHVPSGRTYHVIYRPPRVPARDDVTGEPLIQREDDMHQDAIRNRLQVYHEQTQARVLGTLRRQTTIPIPIIEVPDASIAGVNSFIINTLLAHANNDDNNNSSSSSSK